MEKKQAVDTSKQLLRDHLLEQGQYRTRSMTDPTRGLVYSQGTLLQHLIFAIIAMYIHYVIEPVHRAEVGSVVWDYD